MKSQGSMGWRQGIVIGLLALAIACSHVPPNDRKPLSSPAEATASLTTPVAVGVPEGATPENQGDEPWYSTQAVTPTRTRIAKLEPEAEPMSVVTPAITAPPPNKMGVHLLLDDGRNVWPTSIWDEHLAYARLVVGDWGYVTELVRLDDLDTARWQYFMDLCAELHLKPILRLATTYDQERNWWVAPRADSDGTYRSVALRYATFIQALQWPTEDHYVIVGNEPNHGDEWSGSPDPAAYARFLMDVATAVHAVEPDTRILNAGFDPYTPSTSNVPFSNGLYYLDEETFLDEMIAAYPGVFDHIDVWASHAYPLGPLTEGPWQQTYEVDWLNGFVNPRHVEPPAGIHNRGINGYEWELYKLSTYNVRALPVMITETGWRHKESTDASAVDRRESLPDVTTVGEYLYLAIYGNGRRYPQYPEEGWTPWFHDSRIVAITPFALNGFPAEWGHTNWLKLDDVGTVIGTYPIFEELATQSTQP